MVNKSIFVVTHKDYWMPKDDLYKPIFVGPARHHRPSNFLSDDMGIEISEKNPNYCELTALYWIWKNANEDTVGLCHYRRYFAGAGSKQIMTAQELENHLSIADVVVPKRRNYFIETVRQQYEHAHHSEPLALALNIVYASGSNYAQAADRVMSRRWLYLFNMFVMKKENLDKYCEWLFPVLFEVESKVDISEYDQYESRVFGFLGERLFNIWLDAHPLVLKEVPVTSLEGQDWGKKISKFLLRKLTAGKVR